MNRSVIFRKLWIASERDGTARSLILPNRLLLLGSNGTGKSRIVKSILWSFGLLPLKWKAGTWDTGVVAALEFTWRDESYLVVRHGPRLALFTRAGQLLFCTKKRSEFDARLAALFQYHLRLRRPGGESSGQASFEYLMLPSYLDQDGSWGATWTTFANLNQFKWKPQAFEAFIGERLNAYFAAKHNLDELVLKLNERKKEFSAQADAFRRVSEVLPSDVPVLDAGIFREELAELGGKATETYNMQVALKAKLIATVGSREQLRTELALAGAAFRELNADAVYLTELPEGDIECPTCGAQHENSFHARLHISEDVDTMGALVAELRNRLSDIEEEVAEIRAELVAVDESLSDLSQTATQRKADLDLADLLAAHSRKTLDQAFARVTEEIQGSIAELEVEEVSLKAKLRKLDNPDRKKKVREFYAGEVADFSLTLNVPADEQVDKVKVGDRAQAGGSSAPRSMLAVHLALLRTNSEFGDSPEFPLIVDTPQQSGQDETNLRRMIEILAPGVGEKHQIILAVETLPAGVDIASYEVVTMESKHGALTKEQYAEVVAKLQPLARAMEASLIDT